MKFTFALIASLFASTLAASIPDTAAKSVAAIMQDVTKISKQVTTIDKLITGFSVNSANGATAIHDHAAMLRSVLGDFTNKLNNLPRPVSKAHATEITDGIQSFSPTIIHSMDTLATMRPIFVAISTPSVDAVSAMRADLIQTDGICTPMIASLQLITPPDMTTVTENLVNPINIAVQKAITSFS